MYRESSDAFVAILLRHTGQHIRAGSFRCIVASDTGNADMNASRRDVYDCPLDVVPTRRQPDEGSHQVQRSNDVGFERLQELLMIGLENAGGPGHDGGIENEDVDRCELSTMLSTRALSVTDAAKTFTSVSG